MRLQGRKLIRGTTLIIPRKGKSLSTSNKVLPCNGGIRVSLLAYRFDKTDSGRRLPKFSVSARTKRRLSATSKEDKISVIVFKNGFLYRHIKSLNAQFVNRKYEKLITFVCFAQKLHLFFKQF